MSHVCFLVVFACVLSFIQYSILSCKLSSVNLYNYTHTMHFNWLCIFLFFNRATWDLATILATPFSFVLKLLTSSCTVSSKFVFFCVKTYLVFARTFAAHGCLKWLFIDFFSKMSHFISQKSWKLVSSNQIY